MELDLSGNLTVLAPSLNKTYGTVGCQAGYTYSKEDYEETMVSQFDWVCANDEDGPQLLSISIAGNVVGTIIFNTLSDIYGRRPSFFGTCIVYVTLGVIRLYVVSHAALMATAFFASTVFPPILELSLIVVLEQVSPLWRTRITATTFILWTAGMSTLPLVVWLTRDWRLMGLATTLPYALFLPSWWLLPESPRWLMSQGRTKETADLLRAIAQRNNRPVPDALEEKVQSLAKTAKPTGYFDVIHLFCHRTLFLRTVLLTVAYTCNNLVYYGLTYNITNMSGNVFLNFFLLSITELPSNFLGWITAETFGRRWTHSACFVLAALTSIAAMFTIDEIPWLTTLLLSISKLFVTTSFLIIYLQCTEIYPTTHRSVGTGLSSIISSSIGMSTPYIAYSSTYRKWFPYMIVTAIAITGAISASFLPESLHAELPQTVIEANDFLKNDAYWSYKGKRWSCGGFKKRKGQYPVKDEGHVNPTMSETNLDNQ
ncbi:carcinine transporter-like isoform X2 [Oratosquilla oratoria]